MRRWMTVMAVTAAVLAFGLLPGAASAQGDGPDGEVVGLETPPSQRSSKLRTSASSPQITS